MRSISEKLLSLNNRVFINRAFICILILAWIIGAHFSSAARPGRSHLFRYCDRSRDLDLDLLRLGLLGLGQMHAQHAVFELGADLAKAGVIRLFLHDAMHQPAPEDRGCGAWPVQEESPSAGMSLAGSKPAIAVKRPGY